MLAIVQTIAPIFLLIVAGFAFKRLGFPGEGFWLPAERMVYYLLLPVLIVRNLATADLAGFQVATMALVIVAMALIMTALALALRPLTAVDGAAFTSLLQGAIRLNSYIGFGVGEALFGAPGVILSALFVAVMMPTVNVISISALAAYARRGPPDWRRVPREIARNPIIIACAVGVALNAGDVAFPLWIAGLLSILASAALPVALMCVGAALAGAGAAEIANRALALTCVLKLAVMPAVAFALAAGAGLSGPTLTVVVLFGALPASPASYVLARQLGGDARLMAGILTAQTAAAALTVPLILGWLV